MNKIMNFRKIVVVLSICKGILKSDHNVDSNSISESVWKQSQSYILSILLMNPI